jgi:predicted TPR repeat methyltransferase
MTTLPDSGTKAISLHIEATIDWYGLGIELAKAGSDEQAAVLWNLALNIGDGDTVATAHQIHYIAVGMTGTETVDPKRSRVANFFDELAEAIRGVSA